MEMNVPKMDYKLFVRLNRVKDKYKRHFNEEQVIYRRSMTACYKEISEYAGSRAEDVEDILLTSVKKR